MGKSANELYQLGTNVYNSHEWQYYILEHITLNEFIAIYSVHNILCLN